MNLLIGLCTCTSVYLFLYLNAILTLAQASVPIEKGLFTSFIEEARAQSMKQGQKHADPEPVMSAAVLI